MDYLKVFNSQLEDVKKKFNKPSVLSYEESFDLVRCVALRLRAMDFKQDDIQYIIELGLTQMDEKKAMDDASMIMAIAFSKEGSVWVQKSKECGLVDHWKQILEQNF